MPVPPVPPHPPGYWPGVSRPAPTSPPSPLILPFIITTTSKHHTPCSSCTSPGSEPPCQCAPRVRVLPPCVADCPNFYMTCTNRWQGPRTKAAAFHQPPYRGLSHGPPQQPPPNYNPPGFPEVTAHRVSSHPKTRMLRPLPRRNPSPCVTTSLTAFVSPPGSLPTAVPDTPPQSVPSNCPAAPHAPEDQHCSAVAAPSLATQWNAFSHRPPPHHPVAHDRLPYRTVSQP
jgi:hypothetical protein